MRFAPPLLVVVLISAMAASCAQRPPRRQADPVAAGFQRQTFASLDLAMDRHIDRGDVPGGVLAVARNGAIVYLKAYGVRDPLEFPPAPMAENARFDVASLTKPMITATAAALAACNDELSLGDRILGYSIDEYLRHTTDVPLYLEWQVVERERRESELSPGQAIVRVIERHAIEGPPLPTTPGYSNLGYVLVAEHVENKLDTTLEDYLRGEVWQQLGMTQTGFAPDGPVVRSGEDVRPGRPFDPLADYILRTGGGASPGHSGLFSTARDISFFAQSLMDPGEDRYFGQRCVGDYLLSTRPASRGATSASDGAVAFSTAPGRTPAFNPDRASAGGRALYHTGYTGTLLWIDPETRTSLVLLTNTTVSRPEAWEPLRRELMEIIRRDIR